MHLSTVLQTVSTVGFPIVMGLIFALYIDGLNEETEKFIDALNANTKVLDLLCKALDVIKEG